MLSVVGIVMPIFALILAGWGARRSGVLGPHATGELNRFVVWLALPALLFDIVAKAHWSEIWQPGFVAVCGLGMGVVFALTLALRWRRQRPLADAAIDALNAAYANTGFIGFPLLLAVFGPTALAPTLISAILTVCVLFAAALILIEIGLQAEAHPLHMARKVAGSLARNPLLVAPVLGGVPMAFGLAIPGPVDAFLKLLAASASPCALVALGLFLAEKREGDAAGGRHRPAGGVEVAGAACRHLGTGHLCLPSGAGSGGDGHVLAALPTGTGPFMVAEFYRREAGITARAVLVSTVLSLVTVTLYSA
jgi:predicted permease